MFNPLQLNCPHCGGVLQAKDSSDQGKSVRCPKCHTVFRLELPDQEGEGSGRGPQATGNPQARRRSVWLTVILAVAVIGVAGAVTSLFYKPKPHVATQIVDLTYLPQETDVVAYLRVKDLANSPLLTDVVANPAAQALLTLVSNQSGYSIYAIESLTVGAVVKHDMAISFPTSVVRAPLPLPYSVVVLRSTVPLDEKVLAVDKLKATTEMHAGKTYYRIPLLATQPLNCCYFPEPQVVVIAAEENLKAVIDQGDTPPSIPAFDFVRSDQTAVVAWTSDAIDISPTSPPVTSGAHLVALEAGFKQNFRTAAIGITATDRLSADVIVNCRDVGGAAKFKLLVDTNLIDLNDLFHRQENWLNLSGMSDVRELGEKSLASITVIRTDQQLQVIASVPEELKAVISKYAAGFAPLMPAGAAPMIAPSFIPSFFPTKK
jgi:hypothetical protein